MRVVAISIGFYGGDRKRPGQEFEVPEGTTGKWFVPLTVAKAKEEVKAKSPKAKKEPTTFSELAKRDAAKIPPEGGNASGLV